MENNEERFVREYFEDLGYSFIKLDENQTTKLPDYLFAKGALWFLAEIKNLEEQEEFITGFNIVQKVQGILNTMNLGYNLGFTVYEGILEQELKKGEIKKCVSHNLASANALRKKKFELRGKIRFRINSAAESGSKGRHIGIYGLGKQSDAAKRIRKDVDSAVSKYKKLGHDLPYVLIILPKRVIFDDFDINTGLFGDIVVHFSVNSGNVSGGSRKNSALQAKKNTSIGAVCYYKDNHFRIIHNPFAKIEFPYKIFDQVDNIQYYVNQESGEIREK